MKALVDTSVLFLPFDEHFNLSLKLKDYELFITSYVLDEFFRIVLKRKLKRMDEYIKNFQVIEAEVGTLTVDEALIRDAKVLDATLVTGDLGLVKIAKGKVPVLFYSKNRFIEN